MEEYRYHTLFFLRGIIHFFFFGEVSDTCPCNVNFLSNFENFETNFRDRKILYINLEWYYKSHHNLWSCEIIEIQSIRNPKLFSKKTKEKREERMIYVSTPNHNWLSISHQHLQLNLQYNHTPNKLLYLTRKSKLEIKFYFSFTIHCLKQGKLKFI